jgi:hypothetical protein
VKKGHGSIFFEIFFHLKFRIHNKLKLLNPWLAATFFSILIPASLNFPTIYYTFEAKDRESNKVVEYRVQDLPQTHYKEALSMLEHFFLPDEEICVSRGLLRSPAGIKEVTAFWSEMLNERLSIACFRNDDSNELVAINVFVVSSKDDPKDETVVSGHATGESTLSLSNFLFLVHRRVLDRRPGGARAHERAN